MDRALRSSVRSRSGCRCEYCQVPEQYDRLPFQPDHVIAEKHDGGTVAENLAWSCYDCNIFKGPNIGGIGSEPNTVVRLFHPRIDVWDEHFLWKGGELEAKTEIGIATIHVLRINLMRRVDFRNELIAEGVFPPRQ